MLELKPLDPEVPIFQQIGTDVSPVVLVNVFQVASPHLFTRLAVPNLCVGP